MASGSRAVLWIRRLVPALLGAGLLYLAWRIVSVNDAPVTVDFLLGRIELSVWEALLGAFLCGALLVGLFTLYQLARAGLVSRRYRKKLANLEAEVHQLRNLPLSPDALPEALPEGAPADGLEPLLERGGKRGRES